MTRVRTVRQQQWRMLLSTMFCYLFFYTVRHNVGWAAKGLASDLGISFTMVGWISSAMLIGYVIGQLINGNLADRFSARRMILFGTILSVAGNFATNWKERYKAVLTNRKFIIASLAIGFKSMARYGLIVWVPVHYLGSDWKNNPHYLWTTLLMPAGMALRAFSFGNISYNLFNRDRPASIRMGILVSAFLSLFIFFAPVNSLVISGMLMFFAGFFVYGLRANFGP